MYDYFLNVEEKLRMVKREETCHWEILREGLHSRYIYVTNCHSIIMQTNIVLSLFSKITSILLLRKTPFQV